MNEISERLRKAAESYSRAVAEVLGENLVAVALFGSVARGEASSDSDVDLFIVCRELPPGAFRRQEILEPAWRRVEAEVDNKVWQSLGTPYLIPHDL